MFICFFFVGTTLHFFHGQMYYENTKEVTEEQYF